MLVAVPLELERMLCDVKGADNLFLQIIIIISMACNFLFDFVLNILVRLNNHTDKNSAAGQGYRYYW
jgi:hypothetical protein